MYVIRIEFSFKWCGKFRFFCDSSWKFNIKMTKMFLIISTLTILIQMAIVENKSALIPIEELCHECIYEKLPEEYDTDLSVCKNVVNKKIELMCYSSVSTKYKNIIVDTDKKQECIRVCRQNEGDSESDDGDSEDNYTTTYELVKQELKERTCIQCLNKTVPELHGILLERRNYDDVHSLALIYNDLVIKGKMGNLITAVTETCQACSTTLSLRKETENLSKEMKQKISSCSSCIYKAEPRLNEVVSKISNSSEHFAQRTIKENLAENPLVVKYLFYMHNKVDILPHLNKKCHRQCNNDNGKVKPREGGGWSGGGQDSSDE